MKAAVYHGRRDVRVRSVPDPPDPGPGDLVLEVIRAAICGTDASEWAHGPHLIIAPPVVLGHEFVGRVIAMGPDVGGFAHGDRVVSGAGISCGECAWCRRGRTNLCAGYRTIGLQVDGGLAELVTLPAATCRPVPGDCGDDAAAMAQPLAVALHAARRGGGGPGDTAVVIGAGGVGAFLVAALADRDVERIVSIDLDDHRLEVARSLGAHVTRNPRGRDLGDLILDLTDGTGASLVIEASGASPAPAAALTGVAPGGRVVLVGLAADRVRLDLRSAILREIDITTSVAHVCDEDLPDALQILTDDTIAEVVMQGVIPLDDVVDLGLAALHERTATGKILVDPRR